MRDGWAETTLGEIALVNPEVTKGWSVDRQIRYVDISAVSWGLPIPTDIPSQPFGSAPGRARRVIRKGDVVLSTVRPNLRAMGIVPSMLDGEVASTGFTVLRDNEEVAAPGFVWCVVSHQAFTDDMVLKATGSNYPAIRPADVSGYRFMLPPLEEQRRIVDLTGAVDDVIASAEQAVASQYELLVHLVQFFTGPGTLDDQALESVCEILDKYRRPINEKERSQRPGTVPYYGANGQVGTIDESIFDEPLVLLWEDGGPVQEFLTRPQAYRIDGPAWVNNHAHVLKATKVPTDWLYYSLRHRDLRLHSSPGTRAKITQAQMRRIPIRVASDMEEKAQLMAAVELSAVQTARQVESLRNFRANMLTALLSGEHEIPEPYDDLLDVNA